MILVYFSHLLSLAFYYYFQKLHRLHNFEGGAFDVCKTKIMIIDTTDSLHQEVPGAVLGHHQGVGD